MASNSRIPWKIKHFLTLQQKSMTFFKDFTLGKWKLKRCFPPRESYSWLVQWLLHVWLKFTWANVTMSLIKIIPTCNVLWPISYVSSLFKLIPYVVELGKIKSWKKRWIQKFISIICNLLTALCNIWKALLPFYIF